MKLNFDKIKEIGLTKCIVVFVAGILLLVVSCGDLSGDRDQETPQVSQDVNGQTESDYRVQMERQVVSLLRKVEGVGEVEVMITLAASKEKVTLKDNESSGENNQEETVLIEDSKDNSSPYVLQEKEPVPEGILVVCQGGGNPAVNREIISAIQVLFHVEAHKIKVMKMDSSKGD